MASSHVLEPGDRSTLAVVRLHRRSALALTPHAAAIIDRIARRQEDDPAEQSGDDELIRVLPPRASRQVPTRRSAERESPGAND
jgi:hypothetical protein